MPFINHFLPGAEVSYAAWMFQRVFSDKAQLSQPWLSPSFLRARLLEVYKSEQKEISPRRSLDRSLPRERELTRTSELVLYPSFPVSCFLVLGNL